MPDIDATTEPHTDDAILDGVEIAPEIGPQVIARYVKHLGSGPGVYRMIDKAGEVIYVGKARSLKNRVQNYARLGGHSNRIAAMIRSTATMEFVNTGTEAEALLLEANLIKRFKPRYNVSFRDDKSFPYIVVRRIRKPRRFRNIGARARSKAIISDHSPVQEPSTARSIRYSAPSCCVRARTACMNHHAALSSRPDQACAPMHTRNQPRRLRQACQRGHGLPFRQN